jgi:VanZ family protein
MLLSLRHPRLWLVTGWLLIVFSAIASIVPAHDLPKMPGISDKVEHIVGYALLALWFAGIYPRSRYAMIALGLFVMGVAMEGLQGVTRLGRQADVWDVVANSLGIATGLLLALLWLGGWAQRVEGWSRHQ